MGDGGSQALLNKLDKYQQALVIEMDLRPSEFSKLDTVEVGEPEEFSNEIQKFKIQLAREIKL